jgi:quercetin dioxygenase-like cupin family protein
VDVPEHAHAEQWEFVVSGKVDLHIDGITISHQAGDNFFVPADVPHSARVYAGYRAVIVFNAGDRYEAKSSIGNL